MGNKELRGNGLAMAGSFFHKMDRHKVPHRSGHHKTELNMLVTRRQNMWSVKIIGDEHNTSLSSSRDILHKLLHSGDLAVLADGDADIQDRMMKW